MDILLVPMVLFSSLFIGGLPVWIACARLVPRSTLARRAAKALAVTCLVAPAAMVVAVVLFFFVTCGMIDY